MTRLVLPALLVLVSFGQVQAYELYPWKWTDADIPVDYYINTENIPARVGLTDYVAAVHATFDAWAAVPTSYISFTHEGTGTAYAPYESLAGVAGYSDGHNTIGFVDMPGYVGLASIWATGDRVWEVDIRLSTGQNWDTDGSADADDVQGVLTHEVGHLVGLGHSDVPEATMWAYTWYGDTSRRTLEQDDVSGVSALYPVAIPPIEPATEPITLLAAGFETSEGYSSAAGGQYDLAPGYLGAGSNQQGWYSETYFSQTGASGTAYVSTANPRSGSQGLRLPKTDYFYDYIRHQIAEKSTGVMIAEMWYYRSTYRRPPSPRPLIQVRLPTTSTLSCTIGSTQVAMNMGRPVQAAGFPAIRPYRLRWMRPARTPSGPAAVSMQPRGPGPRAPGEECVS